MLCCHSSPCGLVLLSVFFFFFQAEDGIRDLVRSRGLGDVYKRQGIDRPGGSRPVLGEEVQPGGAPVEKRLAQLGGDILSLIHI